VKALVLEKRDGLAAVLREDGVYATTAQPCEVGETIELSEKIVTLPRRKNIWLRSTVAAVLALALFTGSYSYFAMSASAFVSLDVEEASVEVSVNRLGRVIGVSALNEDSAALAQELNAEMRGKPVEKAMGSAMERFREEGVFDDPESFVIAGVTSGSERNRDELTEAVARAAREAGAEDGEIVAFDVSREERREARNQEMSGGRFAFAQRGGEQPGEPIPSENSGAIAPESPRQEAESFAPADVFPENPTTSEGAQPDGPAPPTHPETPDEPPQPEAGTDAALPEPPSDNEPPYPSEENGTPPAGSEPPGGDGELPTERPDMQGEPPEGEAQNVPPFAEAEQNPMEPRDGAYGEWNEQPTNDAAKPGTDHDGIRTQQTCAGPGQL